MTEAVEDRSASHWGRVMLVIALVYLLAVGWPLGIGFPIDDAFIFFRYAANIAQGHGAVFNLGERVEGYTSFLWVMLLAAFARVGLDIVIWSVWAGLLFAGLTVLCVWRFARRAFDGEWCAAWAGAACLLLGANGCFVCWSYVGMETPLYAFLLTLAMLLFVRELTSQSMPLWSPLVLALAGLARPEAPALLMLNVVVLFLVRRRAGQKWLRPVAQYAILFALITAPFFLWRYCYYGFLFPNTFYAKVGGLKAAVLWRGTDYALRLVGTHLVWFLAILGGIIAWRKAPVWFWYLLSAVLMYMAVGAYEGGDHFGMLRLFVPILPALALLAAYGASCWAAFIAGKERAFLVAVTLVLCVMPNLHLVFMTRSFHRFMGESADARDRALAGRWLRSTARAGETIAVLPAGAIPYGSGLPTVDMLGLNDLHIAHSPGNFGKAAPGHEKYDSDYVLSRRPTYVFLVQTVFDKKPTESEYMAISHMAAAKDLAEKREFKDGYEFKVDECEGRYIAYHKRKAQP
jgi:hypothetical protein